MYKIVHREAYEDKLAETAAKLASVNEITDDSFTIVWDEGFLPSRWYCTYKPDVPHGFPAPARGVRRPRPSIIPEEAAAAAAAPPPAQVPNLFAPLALLAQLAAQISDHPRPPRSGVIQSVNMTPAEVQAIDEFIARNEQELRDLIEDHENPEADIPSDNDGEN